MPYVTDATALDLDFYRSRANPGQKRRIEAHIRQKSRLEIINSSFGDPGPDYTTLTARIVDLPGHIERTSIITVEGD